MKADREAAMVRLQDMFGAGEVGTFMGLPSVAPEAVTGGVAILGVDGCTPYATVGSYCAGGAAAIRAGAAPYAANAGHVDFDLGGPMVPAGAVAVDCGDIAVDDADPAGNRARIQAVIAGVLARGAVPVLLGGDDSVQIPMLAALAARSESEGPLAILQIDAHIDWRDEVGGERWGLSSTMRRASEMAGVGPIVQVGQRGIGSARPGDVADAVAAGVTFVSAREVARRGVDWALDAVPEGARVAICLDVDALDPAIMPAAIGRTAGGLDYWQVFDLILGVAAKARIVAVGVVEFMPSRDIDGQGALLTAQLVAATVGVVARQG
ncbi:MAG: arginase family protein [Gemmobacter sp.]